MCGGLRLAHRSMFFYNKNMMNEKNRFWLKRLYFNKGIPFHAYRESGELLHIEGIADEEGDPFEADPTIAASIMGRLRERKRPVIFVEDNEIGYIAISAEGNIYIGGPVCVNFEKENTEVMYHYRRRHGLPGKFCQMPRMRLTELANLLSLAVAAFRKEYIDEAMLLEENGLEEEGEKHLEWKVAEYFLEKAETSREHVEYGYERKLIEDVRNGRTERFENPNPDDIFLIEKVGKMAISSVKQMEYMVSGAIILAGRAAIDGGISAATAYAVSDLYFQKLEKCRDIVEMQALSVEVMKEFTAMVKAHKERNSTYVEQCKNIIVRNINKDITVEEIAQQIGISRTYLSTKFAEETGMSISRYSIQARIRAAENMLRYSETPITEIAEYLRFSSPSYFGKMFREKNGISPTEYRRRNQVVDFSVK